jgi:Sec-independent protein translocase protein TatA
MQMKFLNIGPLELFFIVLIAIIILGPTETLKTVRTAGQWISRLVRSPYWQSVLDAKKEIRDLPTKLVRESGLDESLSEIKKEASGFKTELTNDLNKARKAMQVDEINISSELSAHENMDSKASAAIGGLIDPDPNASANNLETTTEE